VVPGIGAIREALAGFLAMKRHIDPQTVSVLQGASNLALLAGLWTLRGTTGDGSAVESAGPTREVARRHANGTWLDGLDNPGTGR
jgi:ketosteroid isomerase-like protein